MIRGHSFSHWAAAAFVGALQMAALVSVSGQVNPRLTAQPLVRSLTLTEGEQALVRARAAMKLQNFVLAYREYRSALKLAPRTGLLHDEALRGFSESGVKLAQQRIKEGRAPEAERIAREVLNSNPKYRPALDLLARPSTVKKEVPLVGSAPPQNPKIQPLTVPVRRSLDKSAEPRTATTSAPMTTPAPRTLRSPPPTTSSPPPQQVDAVRKQEPSTAVEEPEDTSDMPEEGPPENSPPPSQTTAPPAVNVKQPLVKVFFATDRRHASGNGPSNYFGSDWLKEGEQDDNLYTGVVTVSIPPVHKEGKVERPFKWWIIEFSEDPKKHFVLTELKIEKANDFYGALRNEYDRREPEKRSAMVFIHGFNVPFDEAAYSTAQLAYDLDFEGVPMMYSWPSQGKLLAYEGDQEAAEWSSPHLQTFLERVARESGALRIHVIAHSMGNRPLAHALAALGHQPDIQPLFDNVIMAAPDVNASTFTQLWPDIKKAAKRFTLYASSDDRALLASRKSKGGTNFNRLGEGGPNIVVIAGLDTVDASGIDTSLLGHSYLDTCKKVMDDLQLLLAKGWTPLERKLRDRQKEGLAYWEFP
ncbi:MAG TPA: alpha/beta hydrolase [Chthoniobacterales bacterium]|nr:alpha/beta hydrolase [Chthoniobacterales bacterium]